MDDHGVSFGTETSFLPGFVVYRYRPGSDSGDPGSDFNIVLKKQLTDKIIIRVSQYEREGRFVDPEFRIENPEYRIACLLKPFRQNHVIDVSQGVRIPEMRCYHYAEHPVIYSCKQVPAKPERSPADEQARKRGKLFGGFLY